MFKNSGYFYDAMYVVGFALMMVINLFTHPRYNIKKRDAVLYTLYTYVCGVVGAMLMGKIYTVVNSAFGFDEGSNVAIFGAVIFTPILIMIFPIKHKQWKDVLDMLTPGILLILACAKLGCFVNGCCRGIECSFGIHYPDTDYKNFPVQICEVVVMLLLLALTQLYIRKAKNYVAGTAYPLTFGIYAVTRFGFEFLRYYPQPELRHLIIGLTFWQFVCIIVLIVSVLWFVILKTRNKKTASAANAEE